MKLPFGISPDQQRQLLANGQAAKDDPNFDGRPVVKLVQPDGSILFLAAELDPLAPTLAYGLLHYTAIPRLRFIDLLEVAADPAQQDLRAAPYLSQLSLLDANEASDRDGCIIDYAAQTNTTPSRLATAAPLTLLQLRRAE